MSLSTVVDSVVGIFSPEARLKRERARMMTSLMRETYSRNYDGAGRKGRGSMWNPMGRDANEENLSSMEIMRNRVRDLYRNNPWAKNGVDVLVNNTVGKGIKLRLDNDAATELWKGWAHTPKCDYNGELNIFGLQRLVARTMFISAECLILKHWRKPSADNPYPIQLQVLEPDFIDTSREETTRDGNKRTVTKVVQGIKYNQQGKVLGYYLFDQHPGSRNQTSIKSKFVSRDRCIHVHDFRRPGESRAVPRLAPIIQRLQNIDQYEDAELQKQKVAALFAAFYRNADCDDIKKVGEIEAPSHMEPGTIEFLPDGYEVDFSNPPSKEGYSEFMRQQLLAISSALGITYESLSSDLRQTSFSSGRIGQHEMTRHVESIQDDVIVPQLCERLWDWFVEGADLMPSPNLDSVTASWHRPARFIVDPKSETEADKLAVRAGFKTTPGVQRDRGEDPEQILEEQIEYNKKIDAAGLVLDTDPRNTDNSGGARKEETPESAESPTPATGDK